MNFEQHFKQVMKDEGVVLVKEQAGIKGLYRVDMTDLQIQLIPYEMYPVWKEQLPLSRGQLLRVFEDQWRRNAEGVLMRLFSLLGKNKRIFARSCQVKRITIAEANTFLDKHHFNQSTISKLKYGLFYKEELVAIATFSAARTMTKREIPVRSVELLRFATKTSYTIVGGLSKLIAFFKTENTADELMTYVDMDWSDGRGFERIGFKIKEQTPARLFFVDLKTHQRYFENRIPDELNRNELISSWNSGNLKMVLNLHQL